MENYLMRSCAPTLAGKKVANLFSYQHKRGHFPVEKELSCWNDAFAPHGLTLYLFRKTEERSLIYLYCKQWLKEILEEEDTRCFLESLNYPTQHLEACLDFLRDRIIQKDGFPHEIGVFLGYPLEDVKNFILHGGCRYKLAGPWKVYGDVNRAKHIFEEYKFCSNYFTCRQKQGYCIFDTMVSFKEEYSYE